MVKISPGQCIYDALGVEKTADAATIRKAYLKLAIQLHPDKNPDDPEANERFQTLQKIYSILSDPEKYVLLRPSTYPPKFRPNAINRVH